MEHTGLNWSLRIFTLRGVEVRIHWTLLAIALFQVLSVAGRSGAWIWLPVLILIPFLSVLLHEFGHVIAARRCGGQADRIVMWAMGGLAMCWVPPKPLKHFLTAAAGPAVNLAICMICAAILQLWPWQLFGWGYLEQGILGLVLGFTAQFNLMLLLFNLIPCYPLDGGAMLRAMLWPVICRAKAIFWTLYLAYAILAVLVLVGGSTGNFTLFLMAGLGLFFVFREHAMIRQGIDPYYGDLPEPWQEGPTLIQRLRKWRVNRTSERESNALAAEQAVLDRLLEKVSTEGLHSLTPKERAELERISKRQRERSGG